MLKKILVSLFIICLSAGYSKVYSQETKAYNFLNLHADARSSSLAGSFISMENDVNSIFYNPAGLSTLKNTQASVGFFKYLVDINSGNAAYSQKYKDMGYIGAGIKYMNYGSMPKYDEQFNEVGTFSASDLAFYVGFANRFTDNLNYGVNLKFIYSNIDEYSSTAVAADFGLLYSLPEKTFNVGISLLNAGAQLSQYIDTKEQLPLNLRFGASKKLDYLPLTVNVALNNLNVDQENFFDRFKNFTIGGEFNMSENVNLRIGYDNQQRQDLKTGSGIGLGGFSAGLGILLQDRYKIDYGFNSMGTIGATHRINLGFSMK